MAKIELKVTPESWKASTASARKAKNDEKIDELYNRIVSRINDNEETVEVAHEELATLGAVLPELEKHGFTAYMMGDSKARIKVVETPKVANLDEPAGIRLL